MNKKLILPAVLVAAGLALAGCSATPAPSKSVGSAAPKPSPSATFDAEEFQKTIDAVVAATEKVVEQAKQAEAEKNGDQ